MTKLASASYRAGAAIAGDSTSQMQPYTGEVAFEARSEVAAAPMRQREPTTEGEMPALRFQRALLFS